MRIVLTKRIIDAVKPSQKDQFLWDTKEPGFGLKATPKGHRVFIFQYWAPHHHRVRRRLTLGTFGALTVDQARTLAERLRGQIANGEDPAADAQQDRQAAKDATVATLSTTYLEEVRAKMKPTTAYMYDLLFSRFILPTLGKTPVARLTMGQVAALHLAQREHPSQANRVVQLLKAFLHWAERRGYRAPHTNPCRDVTPFPEQSRERFLTVEEIGRLRTALTTAERAGLPPAPQHRRTPHSALTAKHRPKSANVTIPANRFAVASIRFLLLTGWREQEALTLKWTDIDTIRGMATLDDTKTGKSHRPLGAPALTLLAGLPRVHGSPYVFPGANPAAPLREIRRIWYAVRHAAGLSDVRLHDLRHTVASFSVGSGHSLYLTGKLLGHARSETTQRDDARKAAADTVSGALAAALDGRETPVTPLRVAK